MGGYVAAPAAWSREPERLAGGWRRRSRRSLDAAEGAEAAEAHEALSRGGSLVAGSAGDGLEHRHRRVVAADAADGAAAHGRPSRTGGSARARVATPQRSAASRAARRPRPTATTAARGRCCRRASAAPPRGRASSSSRCRGGPRHPSRCTSAIGSASTESSESSTAACSSLAQLVVPEALEQPVRHVQAEDGERVRAGCRELGREDRRVAQRVAVDLAGQRRTGCCRRGRVGRPRRAATRAR